MRQADRCAPRGSTTSSSRTQVRPPHSGQATLVAIRAGCTGDPRERATRTAGSALLVGTSLPRTFAAAVQRHLARRTLRTTRSAPLPRRQARGSRRGGVPRPTRSPARRVGVGLLRAGHEALLVPRRAGRPIARTPIAAILQRWRRACAVPAVRVRNGCAATSWWWRAPADRCASPRPARRGRRAGPARTAATRYPSGGAWRSGWSRSRCMVARSRPPMARGRLGG